MYILPELKCYFVIEDLKLCFLALRFKRGQRHLWKRGKALKQANRAFIQIHSLVFPPPIPLPAVGQCMYSF